MSTRNRLARLEKAVDRRTAVESVRGYWRERNEWLARFVMGTELRVPAPPCHQGDPPAHHAPTLRVLACCEARWCGLIGSRDYLEHMAPDERTKADRVCSILSGPPPGEDPDHITDEQLRAMSDEELRERIEDCQRRQAEAEARVAALDKEDAQEERLKLFRRRYDSAHRNDNGAGDSNPGD